MSSSTLEGAIAVVQQQRVSRGTLKALIAIRSLVEWPKHKQNITKLRESGCLKQITAILSSAPQRQCVDLALSILGNCLMDRTCTVEVITQHNILSVLNQLLKKHPKEDSINGRTFRVVGNMCQHREQWATILIDKKPFIISHLVEVVTKASRDELPEGEKISEATVTTALRALRELQNSQTVLTLVKQFGALKAIGALFIKYSEQWLNNDKSKEKMLLDIIRVIYEYSRFKQYHSILEMRNTERGDSLIHLSNVLILAPRKIVKIVMNLIKTSQLQSELPIPEICSKFVEMLEKHSIIKELDGHYTEYLQCLCYLLDHPANRNQERCGKAAILLIKVLREFQEVSNNTVNCCTLLINTLNKFKYDDNLMISQLSHGIIPVLVDKLSWLVGPPNVFSLKHANERKRKYGFDAALMKKNLLIKDDTLMECGINSPSSSDDELDIFTKYRSCPRSPSPCSSSDGESVSALSWSDPVSSPNRSIVHESDSDDYSPVCSEAEDDFIMLDHPTKSVEQSPNFPDLDEPLGNQDLGDEEDAPPETKSNLLKSLKQSLGHEIVKLLKSYLHIYPFLVLRNDRTRFANLDLLMQLTKWSITEQFAVKDVICDIIKQHDHLIPLMKTSYIETLNDMRTIPANHDSCSRCLLHAHFTFTVLREFTTTAESGAGKGEIAHQLMRGDSDTKEKLVMVIPYIVSNRTILGKLMLNCGGLDVLMTLLQKNDDVGNRRSLKVLVQMASNCLLIDNPTKPSKTSRHRITADKYQMPHACQTVVAFELDDGTVIKADRDFLVKQSEFFAGLLDGHFKESGQSLITLSNVDPKTFRCLLHLLHAKTSNTPLQDVDLDLDTLLDVIVMCDRYLLTDLCVSLTDSVQHFRIATETVPVIYNWSVASGTNLLRVESVAYALVANVSERERFEMFRKLFDLGYRERLVEDIEKLLKRYLSLSDFNQRARDANQKARRSTEMRRLLLKQNVLV